MSSHTKHHQQSKGSQPSLSPSQASPIVVGVDGSDESFQALRWALTQASCTGQQVHAVYGWTPSWDMGSQPDSDQAWEQMRADITKRLESWVDMAVSDIDFDTANLTLMSVRASGTSALLKAGAHAQQIVVGRRSLHRIARWLLGSLSSSLVQEATVPVTIVRPSEQEKHVQRDIAAMLAPHIIDDLPTIQKESLPVVAGVDGSPSSIRALQFAADLARSRNCALRVLYCWQQADAGWWLEQIDGARELLTQADTAVSSSVSSSLSSSVSAAVQSLDMLRTLVADTDGELPSHEQEHIAQTVLESLCTLVPGLDQLDTQVQAFHIPALKGLISASRLARHMVVGSSGPHVHEEYYLGACTRQLVSVCECSLTVVH